MSDSESENIIDFKNKNKEENIMVDLEKIESSQNDIYNRLLYCIKDLRNIKNDFKKMKEMQLRIKNRVNQKMSGKKKSDKPKGFFQESRTPDEITKLLGLEKGTKMKRTDVVKQIHKLLTERNLKYEKDQRVFRVDDDFAIAFGLEKKKVNEQINPRHINSFSQYNLQTHMAKLYKSQNNTDTDNDNINSQNNTDTDNDNINSQDN